jgi:hypothetical protein
MMAVRSNVPVVEEDEIRTLLGRLARRHPSGGKVVERAAILAEGADFTEVMAWIEAHGGKPEAVVKAAPKGGLHGARMGESGSNAPPTPSRFVLPPDLLT